MTPNKCPHCGSVNIFFKKSWTLQGNINDKKTGKPFRFRITAWSCRNCGKAFRTSDRLED